MPYDDYPKESLSLQLYDCSDGTLNVPSYYSLVVTSFTGLWTVCGWTKFLVCRQEEEDLPFSVPFQSEFNPRLIVNDKVMKYIQEKHPSSTQFWLHRRFEYDFVNLLSVVMLHIRCNQGKLHLVEVYEVYHPILRTVARHGLAFLGHINRAAVRLWKTHTRNQIHRRVFGPDGKENSIHVD